MNGGAMRVHERYLRWVFGEKRYKEGFSPSDYLFLPLYTPVAFLQDRAMKHEKSQKTGAA